jgi:hypothetical protein
VVGFEGTEIRIGCFHGRVEEEEVEVLEAAVKEREVVEKARGGRLDQLDPPARRDQQDQQDPRAKASPAQQAAQAPLQAQAHEVPPKISFLTFAGNTGGETISGTGSPRGINGYYTGGARTPYLTGLRSPFGITPFFFAPFVFWMPFYWGPYGAYYYPLNATAPALPNNTAHNTSDPIICVCQNYQPCGCDDTNGTYVLPNGTMYAVINGTETAVVNGTLENGTTAPGGTTSSGVRMGVFLDSRGWWVSWVVFGVTVLFAIQSL